MPKDHLATFVCPGFVVKFDNQTITAVESHVPYHFLAGRTLSQYLLLPLLLLYMLGDSPNHCFCPAVLYLSNDHSNLWP